jgi:hypothetical protein
VSAASGTLTFRRGPREPGREPEQDREHRPLESSDRTRGRALPISPPPSRTRSATQPSARLRGSASSPRNTHAAAGPISPACTETHASRAASLGSGPCERQRLCHDERACARSPLFAARSAARASRTACGLAVRGPNSTAHARAAASRPSAPTRSGSLRGGCGIARERCSTSERRNGSGFTPPPIPPL